MNGQQADPIDDLIGELTDREGELISQAFAAIGLPHEKAQQFTVAFGRRWARDIQPWLACRLFFWSDKAAS